MGSEGIYDLTIVMQSPFVVATHEEDGSIPLANDTHLPLGLDGIAYASGIIGDGLHGSAGTKTGDFDYYKVQATAGQTITADFDSTVHLDTIAAIYDSAGNELEFNDDDGKSFTSFISLNVSVTGIYYVLVGGFTVGTNETPDDRFDPSSGQGVGTEGDYSVTIALSSPHDVDYYSFNLAAGDILGAAVTGSAARLELHRPDGTLLIGSVRNQNALGPADSPLPIGQTSLAYVISTPGRYAVAVSTGIGAYTLQLRDFRPALEQQPVYSHQILVLDFDGAVLNAQQNFAQSFGGGGNPDAHLSPLSNFLPLWGMSSRDENAVIDAIVARVAHNLADTVSGEVGQGLNGDFTITNHAGQFQIEILNSRDNPDPGDQYPNVSRVIVGGTLEQLGATFPFYGLAPSIDVGNFDTSETAIVVLDALSAPANPSDPFDGSLNSISRAPGASMAQLIGRVVGNIVSHEAGHIFGNWHAAHGFNNIMESGLVDPEEIAGLDSLFGTADDPDFQFKPDLYKPSEGLTGVEDTLNTIAFGLSTGKQAGTYFDFVHGRLYVTGNVNDGHKDTLKVTTVGTNLQVSINDHVVLTRPAPGVNRVFLNGSDDKDVLDASGYQGLTTLQGRGGDDLLTGGSGDDLLFGDSGNDVLLGGGGNNVLIGGNGDDVLHGGSGVDLLIGGLGSDKLYGGSSGDLLIGGRTAFDANAIALSAILAEWASSRSYETRVKNLIGAGNGTRVNFNYFLVTLGTQSTVFNDNREDLLSGGSGRDWFFATLGGEKKDTIIGLKSNEFVQEIEL